ncbi:MAG: 16S rRNA processing protein RimM [Clostridia bacterium]|nr:16S rRNA processing protein RimM [Clostridia bacterium]
MKLAVGQIVKPQGIKGEVKLDCWLDDSALLKQVKYLYIGDVQKSVRHLRCDGRFCYLLFEGVVDMNGAELLRGMTVFADKNQISLPEGRFFIDDLLGCVVYSNCEKVGVVVDVLQNGAKDVLVLERDKKQILIPWVDDVFANVDCLAKRIEANSVRLSEVICED